MNKLRLKFSKNGPIKFIGHLDVMRNFQKAIRRAEIDIKYSEGFSRETHGKPILSMEDETFFRQISETVVSIDYGHDVILIPEVTEKRYGKKCDRVNGKKRHQDFK